MKRVAIVLFQLGGPDTQAAVEPFLYNLFCDPDIIDFPLAWIARKPLAKLISTRRSKVVAEHYAEIGGSPIGRLTAEQGQALEAALSPYIEAKTFVAMRYWHPLTSEALAALAAWPHDELVLLPLYPHYSYATTRSSLKEWKRQTRHKLREPARIIESFYDHPAYIEALRERVDEKLSKLQNPNEVHLVFSAHGLPLKLIENGDPYPIHISKTMNLVLERGRWPNKHVLCYQSRVGPQKWLEPSLTQTIEWLAEEGVKRMLVIPISFVTDHIETLHEINIEAREEAEELGVKEFVMTDGLNDSPQLIKALADLVLKAVSIERGIDQQSQSAGAARAV